MSYLAPIKILGTSISSKQAKDSLVDSGIDYDENEIHHCSFWLFDN